MTRQRRHQWLPPKNDKVKCSKCGIEVSVDEARRGIGPCLGKRIHKALVSTPGRGIESTPVIDLGACGACNKPLKQVPFNRRLDMVACTNRRCELYRQRLRFVPPLSVAERLLRA